MQPQTTDISAYYKARTAIAYGYKSIVRDILPSLSAADISQIQLDFDWTQYGKPFSIPKYLNREVYWLAERYCNLQESLSPEWISSIDDALSKIDTGITTYRMRVCLATRDLLLKKKMRRRSQPVIFSNSKTKSGIEFINPRDCLQQYVVVSVFRQLGLAEFIDHWYYLINENGGKLAWKYLQDRHGTQVSINDWIAVRNRITNALVKMFELPQ